MVVDMDARRLLLAALVSTVSSACGSGQSAITPPTDAGSDLGPADTGPIDAGPNDTGPSDTGPSDTGPTDVGTGDTGPARCAADSACTEALGGPVCDTITGRCVPCTRASDRCPAGQYCTTDNTCATGCRDDAACMAAGGATGRCDPQTRQCVACVSGDHCAAGSVCVGNVCVMGCSTERPCPGAQTCCDGACVDPQTNVAACGACGNRCTATNAAPACVNGTCTVGMCTAPFADCDNNALNGCETNPQSDLAHCGACGTSCGMRPNATAACTAGACRYTCSEGFGDCDGNADNGCEADLRTDGQRCGACNTRCDLANATATCAAGRCTVGACSEGFGDCDGNAANGCEADTRRSDAHCGACGAACMGGDNAVPVCVSGRCALTCTAGFADCDGNAANGCEVNTTNSSTHCGGCGRTCALANAATTTCQGSLCAVATCATGFADCDGTASNGCEVTLATNVAHCGACGRRCAAGQTCSAGACAGADGVLNVPAGQTRSFADLTVVVPVSRIVGAQVDAVGASRFRVGDEVLVISVQGVAGATGAVGNREFVRVTAVMGDQITVDPAPGRVYAPNGNADLSAHRVFAVRVPHFTTVTIDGTLTTSDFDATAQGIGLVVMRASTSLSIGAQGAVDVTGRGYRSDSAMCNGVWGRPGESLAPQPPTVANECHYANPSNTPNVGGGAGGQSNCNTYACSTQTIGAGGGGAGYGAPGGPGASNGSLHVGGVAGGTYGEPELTRWFFGSGGGAGAGGTSGPGAVNRASRGGGLVFLAAPTLTVSGRISADGQTGGDNANCGGPRGSGSGGGGSGGSIVLQGDNMSLGTITARGGAGGCLGGGAGGVGRIRIGYGMLNGRPYPMPTSAMTTPPAYVDNQR